MGKTEPHPYSLIRPISLTSFLLKILERTKLDGKILNRPKQSRSGIDGMPNTANFNRPSSAMWSFPKVKTTGKENPSSWVRIFAGLPSTVPKTDEVVIRAGIFMPNPKVECPASLDKLATIFQARLYEGNKISLIWISGCSGQEGN